MVRRSDLGTLKEVAKMTLWRRLWLDEQGQGMAEYGLIIALVALVVIGALTLLGTQLKGVFENIGNELSSTVPSGSV